MGVLEFGELALQLLQLSLQRSDGIALRRQLALERRNCFTLTLTRDPGAALGCSLVCEACVRRLELGLMSAGDRQSIAHLKRSNTCVFAGRRVDEVGHAALGKCCRMLLRNTLSTRRLRRHLGLECGPLVVGSRKRSLLRHHSREKMDLLSVLP